MNARVRIISWFVFAFHTDERKGHGIAGANFRLDESTWIICVVFWKRGKKTAHST